MPDGLHIHDNLELTQRELDYLARFLVDLRPFWPLVSTAAIHWISEQFDSEGESWTGGWEPLSEAYAAWKASNFPGKGILSMYGDLRRAATTPRRIVTPNSLTLEIEAFGHSHSGREVDPGWFQEGTDRMPARPLIGDHLTLDQEAQLTAIGETYVDGLIASMRV